MNRIPAAIRRKRREYTESATDEDDIQSVKSSRDPETHFTYTSSEIDSPSLLPVMSVRPPTPSGSVQASSEEQFPSRPSTPEKPILRKSPPLKSSSMSDVSKISKKNSRESESLIKPVGSFTPASKPGNLLYIPEIRSRLSAAVSESSLWHHRSKPWLDGTNVDFRGSMLISSQGLNVQQHVHPRKTEKVAQVSHFTSL